MFKQLLIVFLMFPWVSFAQLDPSQSQGLPPLMSQEGKFFVVRLVPGAKKIEIAVTGTPVASVRAGELGLKASIEVNKKREIVHFERDQGRFLITLPEKTPAARLHLEVRDKKHSEKFKFELSKP